MTNDNGKRSAKAVDEFDHNIDLSTLQSETGMTLDAIAAMAGYRNPKGVYAWNKPKAQCGSRPSFNTIARLLSAGASVHTLFGVGEPPTASTGTEPPATPPVDDGEVERAVMRVLSKLAGGLPRD